MVVKKSDISVLFSVIILVILQIVLGPVDARAFDRHRLSFSIGGDWSDCLLIRKQIYDPSGNPTTLMSINENIPGSIGFSGRFHIKYLISRASIYTVSIQKRFIVITKNLIVLSLMIILIGQTIFVI